jgi:phytanoyl-CoA hydroxylase
LALTVTIAVDESVPENGALVCQAGSHQIGLLPHRQSGIQGFSRCLVDPVDTASYPEVQLCMQPGDICLHHINTVHRSGANELDRPRRQLGLLYRSSLAQRDTEAWDQYHKDLNLLHKSTQSS